MSSKVDNRALDHKCPACRAPIEFKVKLGKWKCDYCDNEYTLDDLKKYNNASSEKVNLGAAGDDTQYDSYRCKNCGAEIIADEHTASTFCLYCGNTAILKSKLSGKFAPTKIIPFKKEKEDAIKAFKGLKKFRPLLPNDFVSQKNIEKITGLYVPFWLFNVMVDGNIECKAVKSTSWSVGDTVYTKTDTYSLIRGGSVKFNMIPVDGSSRFNNDIMNTIEPFDYSEMVDYNHAYLSGFLSEKYDVDAENSRKECGVRAINSATEKFKSEVMGYGSVVLTQNNLAAREMGREYALLPVFMVNVKYKDKFYIFAMNGQTGEFIGNMPISVPKLIVNAILIFILTLLIFLIVSFINYKILGGAV